MNRFFDLVVLIHDPKKKAAKKAPAKVEAK